nr:uncharacterized protein LOC109743030 [Aegilops tauschii subsp. strangulata]
MVFEDESSDSQSSLVYVDSSSSGGMQFQIPASIEDLDYMGIETTPPVLCEHHRLPAERRVAFEAFHTGRRFLACSKKGNENCGFVQWVDPEWPPTMQNALLKLLELYSNSRKDKNNLEANYDKLVEDVHQLFNAQEDRMMDFSYLPSKMKNTEVSSSVVFDMRTEIEKKDAEIFELQEKYEVLMNITKAQGTVIQNLKLNHLKEKEKLIQEHHNDAMKMLQLRVDELTKSNEKLIQENHQIELHGDLKKGHQKLFAGRDQLKLHIADLLKAEEKNKQKLKGIQAILAD